jgi:transposase
VEHWATTLPLDLLWAPGVQATAFNDDAWGRVLEKLAVCGRTVLGTLGIRWQALGQAAPTLLHTDTTSFSIFGDYPGLSPDGEAPHITYGYSKAHRPDLKQIVLGLTTDAEGQILLGDVLAGNTSDKAWMPTWLPALDREIPTDAWKQALYVTDRAGITPAALAQCAALDVRWLGRLPETHALARAVKEAAWAAPASAWTDLGTFSPRKNAAHYRAQIHPGILATYPIRCVVVHSDALDRRRERTLQREISTEAEALWTAASALARQVFACVPDAGRRMPSP